jgi:hypothetical protein
MLFLGPLFVSKNLLKVPFFITIRELESSADIVSFGDVGRVEI